VVTNARLVFLPKASHRPVFRKEDGRAAPSEGGGHVDHRGPITGRTHTRGPSFVSPFGDSFEWGSLAET